MSAVATPIYDVPSVSGVPYNKRMFAVAVEKFRGPERGSRPCGLLLEQVPDLPPVDQVFGAEQRVVGGPFRRGARRIIGVVYPDDRRVGHVARNDRVAEGRLLGAGAHAGQERG